MCGICGVISPDGAVKVKVLQRMLKRLEHRGPDDWGIYVKDRGKFTNEETLQGKEGYLMLGNRRLSIIDLSRAGNQPMPNEDESVWISHNGEVYNYRDLRKTLVTPVSAPSLNCKNSWVYLRDFLYLALFLRDAPVFSLSLLMPDVNWVLYLMMTFYLSIPIFLSGPYLPKSR